MLRKPTLREKRYIQGCDIHKPGDWLVKESNDDGLTIVNRFTGDKTILVRRKKP